MPPDLRSHPVSDYTIIIIITLVGFIALAALLLVPVYNFIQKEKKAASHWTKEEMARRSRERPSPNGANEH